MNELFQKIQTETLYDMNTFFTEEKRAEWLEIAKEMNLKNEKVSIRSLFPMLECGNPLSFDPTTGKMECGCDEDDGEHTCPVMVAQREWMKKYPESQDATFLW